MISEALEAGDFNGDGRADLAIGVPADNGHVAGVHILYGNSKKLRLFGAQYWTRATFGALPINSDRFGAVMA